MPDDQEKKEGVPNDRRKVFFGLFVFPMLIAVTMALLLSGIVLLTHEEETPESLIMAIKTGAPSKRWQKAFELSNELNREGALIRSVGIMNEIIHILNDRDHYDAKTRAYMAMALGRFERPEAERALEKALREADDTEDPQLALFLMWAIGNLAPQLRSTDMISSPTRWEGTVAKDLTRFLESKHDDLRKTAAYVLGVLGTLGDKNVIPLLEHALEDPIADVRWNSALSLARLGDSSGGKVLLQMLDRNYLYENHRMNEPEIERVMINAAKALSLIDQPEAVSILEHVSQSDQNLKVRQAALMALEQL